jgi:hypothetical protein
MARMTFGKSRVRESRMLGCEGEAEWLSYSTINRAERLPRVSQYGNPALAREGLGPIGACERNLSARVDLLFVMSLGPATPERRSSSEPR